MKSRKAQYVAIIGAPRHSRTPLIRNARRALAAIAVAALTATGSAASAVPCLHWQPAGTWVATGVASTYDVQRDRLVLFGGDAHPDGSGETWEYDGTHWERVVVAGPTPRRGAALAYDSARGVVVLFGGEARPLPATPLGDTWEWDGVTWSRRATTGPAPRGWAAMGYDAVRGVIVLHGGYAWNAPPFEDTWEWDGRTWTRRAMTGPGVPPGTSLTFDPARQVMLLAGGYPSAAGGLWAWNGQAWARHDTDGGGWLSALTADPVRGVVVQLDTASWTIREWDGTQWSAPLATVPPGLAQSMAPFALYDSVRQRCVLGVPSGAVVALWTWDGTTVAPLQPPSPPPLHGHAIAFDRARAVAVLFGGWETNPGGVPASTASAATWTFDGHDWTLATAAGPTARALPAMAYDSVAQHIVLFGGQTLDGPSGQTWAWDGADWTLLAETGPAPRYACALAFDDQRGRLVLHGGQLGGGESGETWEFDGIAWTLASTGGPSPRRDHAMAYDPARGVTVLHGGRHGDIVLADTWDWDGSTWQQRGTDSPVPRYGHRMVYDGTRGAVILAGGRAGAAPAVSTAAWDGTAWTPLCTTGVTVNAAMAYDEVRGRVLQFGGAGGGHGGTADFGSNGTYWLDDIVPYFTQYAADQRIAPQGTATFAVATQSAACDVHYQWYHVGTPLTDDERITGATTSTLRITGATATDAGPYTVTATLGNIALTSIAAHLAVVLPGDTNCDGAADTADIDAFVMALVDPASYATTHPGCDIMAADCNADGLIDTADIDAFVALLVGAG